MQVHTELNNIAISNNDDRILHCCLLYQEKVKVHGGMVVLFSNDVQLCSKAMVNQVKALNRKTLLNDLRTLFKGGDLAPVVSSQGQSHSGHAHYNPPPALIGAHQASATPPPAAVPVTRAEVSIGTTIAHLYHFIRPSELKLWPFKDLMLPHIPLPFHWMI